MRRETEKHTTRIGRARRHRLRRRLRVWTTVVASLSMVAGATLVGGAVLADRWRVRQDNLLGASRGEVRSGVTGPLNFLLIGSNWREDNPSNGERADSIVVVHIPRDLKTAYLVAVPRDLRFPIQAFPPTGFRGSTEKIDAALNFGGMPLMSQTVSELTGLRFDGAVMARFDGFRNVVDALGGVDLCVDVETRSIHTGATFAPGCRRFGAHQALDYLRQRMSLDDGDYGRQRHAQQFMTATLRQLGSDGTLSNPMKLDRAIRAVNQAMTVDTNGTSVAELVFALRDVQTVGVRTPSHPQRIGPTWYVLGDPGIDELWGALRDDTMDSYVATHPALVNKL